MSDAGHSRTLRILFMIALCCLGALTMLSIKIIHEGDFDDIRDWLHDEADLNDAAIAEIDWDHWRSINEDIVGWLAVEGTGINCPIVQANANMPEFYLTHAFDGSPDDAGCPFLDAKCECEGLLSKNSVVFGHHLNDGKGFSPFAQYSDRAFAEAHSEIILRTPTWNKRLHVIAAEITQGTANTKVTSFQNDGQFLSWLHERLNNSCVKLMKEQERIEPARIWTFCTCSYTTYADERTLVYAIE